MKEYFIFDERLGIAIPTFSTDWDRIPLKTQHEILLQWEIIRGRIPDRIAEIEGEINQNQAELDEEFDFERSCKLNSKIAELASTINDLWIWFRTRQNVTAKMHT